MKQNHNGISTNPLAADVVNTSFLCIMRRALCYISLNMAVREIRDRLVAICNLAEEHLKRGGDFTAESLGDEFLRHLNNLQPQAEFIKRLDLHNSHPGLREQVRDRFVKEINSFLAPLPTGIQIGIWGKLLQSNVCTGHLGITVPIASFQDEDPVFRTLGYRNELPRFFGDVAVIACDKLAQIGSIEALACVVCFIAEGTRYPQGEQALSVLRAQPDEKQRLAITMASDWHAEYKRGNRNSSQLSTLDEKIQRLKHLEAGNYRDLF